MEPKDLLRVGKILTPHGVRGMLKIISYMQNPNDLFRFNLMKVVNDKVGNVKIKMLNSIGDATFICSVDGVATRTDAEKLVKNFLFINKAELPDLDENEFYIEDLKGMQVVDVNDEHIGVINALYNFGAGDIIEIEFNNGKTEMYDFNDNIFPEIKGDKITFVAPKML
jgi:16S rRNA processing protein RimM